LAVFDVEHETLGSSHTGLSMPAFAAFDRRVRNASIRCSVNTVGRKLWRFFSIPDQFLVTVRPLFFDLDIDHVEQTVLRHHLAVPASSSFVRRWIGSRSVRNREALKGAGSYRGCRKKVSS